MYVRHCLRTIIRRFSTSPRRRLHWKGGVFNNTIFVQRLQQGYSGNLWRYFNAPGNAFFVSTNIVTLTGMVLYSTACTMSRQASVVDSLENGFPVEKSSAQVSNKNEMPAKLKQVDLLEDETESQILRAPNSYLIKMTLFYLFYSFHVYKQALETGVDVENETLQQLLTNISKIKGDGLELSGAEDAKFYKQWKFEFKSLFRNLSKAQQFHLPKSESFPKDLRNILERLENSPMTYHSDFYEFYQSVNDISQRRLLQLWYYDNSRNFMKKNSFSNERIYEQMVFESSQWNNVLFERYLSILYDPTSHKFKTMFNNSYYNGISSVSLDTMLAILKGLITSNLSNKNDHIVKVVSLLRKNSVVNAKKNLRILLPTDDKQPLLDQIMTTEKRKQTYSAMARNPVALKLLSILGGVTQD